MTPGKEYVWDWIQVTCYHFLNEEKSKFYNQDNQQPHKQLSDVDLEVNVRVFQELWVFKVKLLVDFALVPYIHAKVKCLHNLNLPKRSALCQSSAVLLR